MDKLNLRKIKEEFNRGSQSLRLISLLSPT